MQIRPLKPGEEPTWVRLDCEEHEFESRLMHLLKYRQQNPAMHPGTYLVAVDGEKIVGKLRTNTEDPGEYILSYLAVGAKEIFNEVGAALLQHAKDVFSDRPLEAGSWDNLDDAKWHDLLLKVGFNIYIEKMYVNRDLTNYRMPYGDPFTYRSIAEVGEEEFLTHFSRIYEDNQNRNFGSDPRADYADLLTSQPDPRQWQIAYLTENPIGVVVPKIFEDIPEEGTIHTFGLFPEYRRRGFGKILHAKGLKDLAQSGATRYIGSTDKNNSAMIATFKANDCLVRGLRRQYRLRPS